jgi:DNA mismatch repair protein MutL
MDEFFKKHRPVETQDRLRFGDVKSASALAAESQQRNVMHYEALRQEQTQPWNFLQIHDSYIVVQTDEGFEILDQHALHERIMYNQIKQRLTKGNLESQKLLLPETFEVNAPQQRAIENNAEIFEKLGLEIVPFGPKTIAIQSFASILAGANPADFVSDLLDLLADKGEQFDEETLLDEIINMAACKGAIKAGQKLTGAEIAQLLSDRKSNELSSRCAHGRPTVIRFSISDLEKQFKRT